VGAPQGFDFRAQRTLGLQTVFSIAEHQLRADISVEARDGVAVRLSFTDNLYTARV
jgi:two-component sensor histidine kinase